MDLIIVGHVMYYFKEEMQTLIEKFTTWLNPGGVILMSHSAPNDLFCEIGTDAVTYCKPFNFDLDQLAS